MAQADPRNRDRVKEDEHSVQGNWRDKVIEKRDFRRDAVKRANRRECGKLLQGQKLANHESGCFSRGLGGSIDSISHGLRRNVGQAVPDARVADCVRHSLTYAVRAFCVSGHK
jgi:hypothetical protein